MIRPEHQAVIAAAERVAELHNVEIEFSQVSLLHRIGSEEECLSAIRTLVEKTRSANLAEGIWEKEKDLDLAARWIAELPYHEKVVVARAVQIGVHFGRGTNSAPFTKPHDFDYMTSVGELCMAIDNLHIARMLEAEVEAEAVAEMEMCQRM